MKRREVSRVFAWFVDGFGVCMMLHLLSRLRHRKEVTMKGS